MDHLDPIMILIGAFDALCAMAHVDPAKAHPIAVRVLGWWTLAGMVALYVAPRLRAKYPASPWPSRLETFGHASFAPWIKGAVAALGPGADPTKALELADARGDTKSSTPPPPEEPKP